MYYILSKLRMKILKILIICFLVLFTNSSFAQINMDVSPIKYEIESDPWTNIVKTAKIRNNWSNVANIVVWKSNFTTWWPNWQPKFVNSNELASPNEQLASWITLNETSFTLNPNQEKEITFNINIPSSWTPWWHYWAIMFKNTNNDSLPSPWTTSVWVNVDYAVLVLLKVKWEVISKWEILEPKITLSYTSNTPGKQDIKKDDCLIDLTKSSYDWKCIDNPLDTWTDTKNTEKAKPDFSVKFDIPFKNDWNTHLKPTWKIKLIDENWNELKSIWKEVLKNNEGAIIWQKVVDYIPINDIWWNILPNTKRDFNSEWKWFPYKAYDVNWNEVIKYWSPWDYYTKINVDEKWPLMFWERIAEKKVDKNIKADINLSYKNDKGETVELKSAKDFKVQYNEKYIWLNPYVIIPLTFFLIIILILFYISRRSKTKCKNCWKKIHKKMKLCPYCWKKTK